MSGYKKFKEELSSKERHVKNNDKEYEYVLTVRDRFEMKTMKNHHKLYLKCDVLLLVGVFEKFRNSHLKNYGLCPSHYLNAPVLS